MIKANFQEEKNFQPDYPLTDLNLKKKMKIIDSKNDGLVFYTSYIR